MLKKLFSHFNKTALLMGGLLLFFCIYSYAQDNCDYSLYQTEVNYWQAEYLKTYDQLNQSQDRLSEITGESEMAEIISIGQTPDSITEITVFYYDAYDEYDWYDLR